MGAPEVEDAASGGGGVVLTAGVEPRASAFRSSIIPCAASATVNFERSLPVRFSLRDGPLVSRHHTRGSNAGAIIKCPADVPHWRSKPVCDVTMFVSGRHLTMARLLTPGRYGNTDAHPVGMPDSSLRSRYEMDSGSAIAGRSREKVQPSPTGRW